MPSACANHPITIPLNTADPVKARRLANRLAVEWDDMVMQNMTISNRGTLTLGEQELLFRKGLENELAKATAHLTAPIAGTVAHPAHHKVLSTAYRIVSRVSPDAKEIGVECIDAEVDEGWTPNEIALLTKCLRIFVTPQSVNQSDASHALALTQAPVNEGTLGEARSQLLRGMGEAQSRAELLTNPRSGRTVDMLFRLLDDDKVAEARVAISTANDSSPVDPIEHGDAVNSQSVLKGIDTDVGNLFFARTTEVRFSDQIDILHKAMFEKNNWQLDGGKTLHMLQVFAWLTGDKKMSDYEPADIDEYANRLARIPKGFNWGTRDNPGEMATPYEPNMFSEMPPPKERRSIRTNNSHFSKMAKAAEILKKTHWLPRHGYSQVIAFDDVRKRVNIDESEPRRVPLTEANLVALYNLPIWQGGGGKASRLKPDRSPTIYQDAAYWVPLLATYSGMGREEICGLEIIDFDFGAKTPFMLVRENMTKSKDGLIPAGLKRLSRKRAVPIHPKLIELGLIRYVEAIASEGHIMAFPELYGRLNSQGVFKAFKKRGGSRFYAIAWRYMIDAAHAIEPLPMTKDGKHADFYSQRTFVFSAMASEEVSEALLARQVGHSQKGTGNKNYNRRALALGEDKELAERLTVVVREVPNVTAHVVAAKDVNLLHLNHRSKVGSAPDRNAADRFLA